jgi:phenazine biosynthesis protein phzE
VLSSLLGLELRRKQRPNQGVQKKIDLFGAAEQVGFYNTFAAQCDTDEFTPEGLAGVVRVSRGPVTGEVHGLSGPHFASVQFHPESILTGDGVCILRSLLASLPAD